LGGREGEGKKKELLCDFFFFYITSITERTGRGGRPKREGEGERGKERGLGR